MKETPKLKVTVTNIENMEDIDRELEEIKARKTKKQESEKAHEEHNLDSIVKEIATLSPIDDYNKIIRDIYDFLAFMKYSERSYELVLESIELRFRRSIYEAITSKTNDKEEAFRIYSEFQLNKIIADINEYISKILHVQEQDDHTNTLYLIRLISNINENIRLFYDINNLDHNSYREIMKYLLGFMDIVYPGLTNGKTV